MIYTSYFAKIKSMPKDIVPVAICAKLPEWYDGLHYRKLAPSYDFFMNWKEYHDNDTYSKCFNKQILDKLDSSRVVNDLYSLIDQDRTKAIVLVCYEKPYKFCHRHLVADWLNRGGFESEEFVSIFYERRVFK